MRKPKKPKQGGARPGAGRKSQFDEETVRIGFRVPKSKSDIIKTIVNNLLEEEKQKSIMRADVPGSEPKGTRTKK